MPNYGKPYYELPFDSFGKELIGATVELGDGSHVVIDRATYQAEYGVGFATTENSKAYAFLVSSVTFPVQPTTIVRVLRYANGDDEADHYFTTKKLKEISMSDVDNTLAVREKSYGSFRAKAEFIQVLKTVLRAVPNWSSLDADMQEALDMVVAKVARICFGDPKHKDSWHDIAGYASLVDKRLGQEQE